jgi:hypothetical protein
MSHIELPHFQVNEWKKFKSALRGIVSNPQSLVESPFPVYELSREHSELIEFLAERALEIESLFQSATSLPTLRVGDCGDVRLTQRQCLCLLSHGFFGTFSKCQFDGQSFSLSDWSYQPECINCFMAYVTECKNRMGQSRDWQGTNVRVPLRLQLSAKMHKLINNHIIVSYAGVF